MSVVPVPCGGYLLESVLLPGHCVLYAARDSRKLNRRQGNSQNHQILVADNLLEIRDLRVLGQTNRMAEAKT